MYSGAEDTAESQVIGLWQRQSIIYLDCGEVREEELECRECQHKPTKTSDTHIPWLIEYSAQ